MSAELSLYEGILLVLAFVVTYLALREATRIKITVEEIRETNRQTRKHTMLAIQEIRDKIEIYSPSLDAWKEKIDENLELTFAEHLFLAIFNVLVHLGASDMGKAEKAKQTMAIHGFQRIGQALGKGIKKEIPAVDALGGMAGGGGAGSGSLIEMAANMFGFELPPGAADLIAQKMNDDGGQSDRPARPKKAFE